MKSTMVCLKPFGLGGLSWACILALVNAPGGIVAREGDKDRYGEAEAVILAIVGESMLADNDGTLRCCGSEAGVCLIVAMEDVREPRDMGGGDEGAEDGEDAGEFGADTDAFLKKSPPHDAGASTVVLALALLSMGSPDADLSN